MSLLFHMEQKSYNSLVERLLICFLIIKPREKSRIFKNVTLSRHQIQHVNIIGNNIALGSCMNVCNFIILFD